MGIIAMMVVALNSLYLISCGDDDDGIDKKELVNNDGENNGGGDNNEGEKTDVPQELLRGWQRTDPQTGIRSICYFNSDGTGKQYIGVESRSIDRETFETIAQSVSDFVYSYKRQNSTLTLNGTEYVLAFQNSNTRMTLSINDVDVMTFYSYSGDIPKIEQDSSIPTGVTATVDGSSILVSWQSVSGAKSYKIYRSSSANGSYSLIGTASSASYKDNSPISGYNYYKVSAVSDKGEGQQSSYAVCNYTNGGGNTVPSTPTGVTASVNGSSILLSWQPVSNANSYKIYLSSSAYGSYSLIGTVSSTSCRVNSPISGYNYFKVSAVNNIGESQQSSYAVCNYTGGSTIPNAPTGVTVSNEGNNYYPSIRISWSSVSNATSYNVYRSSSANGSYSQIGSSSYTYMYDNNPMSGNNYYKVKAVNSAGESQYSSYAVYNNNPEFSPCPPTVKVSGTTSQTVTWTNSTSNACGEPTSYEVYKEDPYTGKYEFKKTTTYTSYSPSSSDIHPGKNWYAIKAINNSGADIGYAYSQEVPLAKPSSFTAQKSGSYLKFTWSKVAWATGYQIFESSSASGSYSIFTQVDDGSQTSLTIDLIKDYPISSGTTRYYKIRAIHQSKLVSFDYSDQTTYKSVKF